MNVLLRPLCETMLLPALGLGLAFANLLHRHVQLRDIPAIAISPTPNMAVWQWFKSIPPKTRMIIGVGVMAYAGAGLYLSDMAEEKLGFTPTEKDKEQLRNAMPKMTAVEKRNT